MKYVPELDGLRAIAVTLVILAHCGVPHFEAGYAGVDVFFVLSGYLITRILLAEHALAGDISMTRFYCHRALRLFPALLLMLVVFMMAAPHFWPRCAPLRDALVAGFYMMDYAVPFSGVSHCLEHTWSLGVEEKFYLLWPAVLVLALQRFSHAQVARGVLVMIAVAMCWQSFNLRMDWSTYYRFDTRIPGLLCGCWLGIVATSRPAWFQDLPFRRMAWGGVALLALALATGARRGESVMTFTIPITNLATVGLIAGAAFLPLRSAPLVWIGKLSYGIYLWHAMFISIPYNWHLKLPIVFACALAAAAASYWTVEALGRKIRVHVDLARSSESKGISGTVH